MSVDAMISLISLFIQSRTPSQWAGGAYIQDGLFLSLISVNTLTDMSHVFPG